MKCRRDGAGHPGRLPTIVMVAPKGHDEIAAHPGPRGGRRTVVGQSDDPGRRRDGADAFASSEGDRRRVLGRIGRDVPRAGVERLDEHRRGPERRRVDRAGEVACSERVAQSQSSRAGICPALGFTEVRTRGRVARRGAAEVRGIEDVGVEPHGAALRHAARLLDTKVQRSQARRPTGAPFGASDSMQWTIRRAGPVIVSVREVRWGIVGGLPARHSERRMSTRRRS